MSSFQELVARSGAGALGHRMQSVESNDRQQALAAAGREGERQIDHQLLAGADFNTHVCRRRRYLLWRRPPQVSRFARNGGRRLPENPQGVASTQGRGFGGLCFSSFFAAAGCALAHARYFAPRFASHCESIYSDNGIRSLHTKLCGGVFFRIGLSARLIATPTPTNAAQTATTARPKSTFRTSAQ